MPLPVLICDDSLMARKQVMRSLPPEWDVEISYASNGREGIDAIKAGKGDVVFLDLNMPEMDGYEVLAQVQSQDLPALVIVVSGDIQPEAHQRVKQLGALDFIQKPTSKEKIAAVLKAYGISHDIGSDHAPSTTPATSSAIMSAAQEHLDSYREVANVAMGRAGDILARALGVFVQLPIPNVNILTMNELRMALRNVQHDNTVSAVCQGYIGAGIAGEAMLIFHDSSFADLAKLMNYPDELDASTRQELLMDIANILIGTNLKGLAEQLDVDFAQNHPMLLGQHCDIDQLLNENQHQWNETLAIEINYSIENHNIHCNLLILITEDSLTTLNNKIAYLVDSL